MDREDGIRRHRRSLLDVPLAEGLEIFLLAVTLDQNEGAGNSPRCDFAVDEILNG
jgi:hypothetical protein